MLEWIQSLVTVCLSEYTRNIPQAKYKWQVKQVWEEQQVHFISTVVKEITPEEF